MSTIAKNLNEVLTKIEKAYKSASICNQKLPRLVAVSKEKPVEDIIEAYDAGQRCFGENKITDLFSKSTSPQILNNCQDIKWHFIGRLQSNKIKKLVAVHNLVMVETVDSIDHAKLLNSSWGLVHRDPLDIMIQVNTSNEPR